MSYSYEYIALGVLLIVLGSFAIIRNKRKRQRCSVETEAIITSVEEQKSTRFDKTDPEKRKIYFPTYTYKAMGKEFSHKSEFPHKYNDKPKTGDTVSIWYNPDKPDEIVTDLEMNSANRRNLIILLIGVAFCIVTMSFVLTGRKL